MLSFSWHIIVSANGFILNQWTTHFVNLMHIISPHMFISKYTSYNFNCAFRFFASSNLSKSNPKYLMTRFMRERLYTSRPTIVTGLEAGSVFISWVIKKVDQAHTLESPLTTMSNKD
ncbi:unnamed protein product [Arabidopsis thaliana]|uniref:Uncharacterized protein n=3 Tax=Arabidopsis TaxID=3701 RepID=Q9FI57_ARATH|nr:uncharacterized protein AT5G50910 [Arabidopsis thaliana]KAG7612561.1 hypothetical protein ISN44_As05g045690 [Arabidopsis suecica]AED96008.1 hypothetical protein AT5G50910 [Arabidopsis thaliana]CAA0408976.1 unnamed protein product [Arabidopsis thaliana]VYS69950.1 unnamed protein product [Arabidopsis thaliana]BAB08737.1 unnamed protein product [Arabidopsis thaliana]|eukprot:NP_199904.1 hypothetical protein AT5G50910 [Arabidopsis thaliana]